MEEATVSMPLHLTHDLIQAVRNNALTKCDDKDEMNTRIGWLICAYDAMVEQRCKVPNIQVQAGTEAGEACCSGSHGTQG